MKKKKNEKLWVATKISLCIALLLGISVIFCCFNERDNRLDTLQDFIAEGYEVVTRGYNDNYIFLLKGEDYSIITKATDDEGQVISKVVYGSFPFGVSVEDLVTNVEASADMQYLKDIVEINDKTYYLYTSDKWAKLIEVPGTHIATYYSKIGGSIALIENEGVEYFAFPKEINEHAKYLYTKFSKLEDNTKPSFEIELIPYSHELCTYSLFNYGDSCAWEWTEEVTLGDFRYDRNLGIVSDIKNYLNMIIPNSTSSSYQVEHVSYGKVLEAIEEVKTAFEEYEADPNNIAMIAEEFAKYSDTCWLSDNYGGSEWYSANQDLINDVKARIALEEGTTE